MSLFAVFPSSINRRLFSISSWRFPSLEWLTFPRSSGSSWKMLRSLAFVALAYTCPVWSTACLLGLVFLSTDTTRTLSVLIALNILIIHSFETNVEATKRETFEFIHCWIQPSFIQQFGPNSAIVDNWIQGCQARIWGHGYQGCHSTGEHKIPPIRSRLSGPVFLLDIWWNSDTTTPISNRRPDQGKLKGSPLSIDPAPT